MPEGPQEQKHPAALIGAGIKAEMIATGEVADEPGERSNAAAEPGRKGGKTRTEKMAAQRRKVIADRVAELQRAARLR